MMHDMNEQMMHALMHLKIVQFYFMNQQLT